MRILAMPREVGNRADEAPSWREMLYQTNKEPELFGRCMLERARSSQSTLLMIITMVPIQIAGYASAKTVDNASANSMLSHKIVSVS